MSIVQTLTTSFKGQLPLAVHDFTTDTMKLALYLSTANLGADTTVYTATGESTGTGYTKRKVCPSSRRTCTQLALSQSSSCHELPCPTLSFSLFHASKSKQRSLGSRQNTTHTTSTRVINSTIGWILTTWDFLKTINYYLSF